LQLASLVNTAVSLAACPAIVYLSDASPIARALVAVGVVGFGAGTTLGLQWFTSPYVHELRVSGAAASSSGGGGGGGGGLDASTRVRAKTLTLLGRPRWSEFRLGDVQHPDTLRPLATFQVSTRACRTCRGPGAPRLLGRGPAATCGTDGSSMGAAVSAVLRNATAGAHLPLS
jgi:hypothetical protein